MYIYIYVYICINTSLHYIYICFAMLKSKSQIMHHILCFNLFMLHNNSFDNQGSEINKNSIFNIFTHCLLWISFLLYKPSPFLGSPPIYWFLVSPH